MAVKHLKLINSLLRELQGNIFLEQVDNNKSPHEYCVIIHIPQKWNNFKMKWRNIAKRLDHEI